MFKVPEKFRLQRGIRASMRISVGALGNNGVFQVRTENIRRAITVVAWDKEGWEHVSASLPDRFPTWQELAEVKAQFWGERDLVVQVMPTSYAPRCDADYSLHLWRKKDDNKFCELPPTH